MNPERPINPLLTTKRKPSPYPRFFGPPRVDQLEIVRKMGRGFHRWDMTRRVNPFIDEQSATGFEGYFVGLNLPPEEVAQRISEIGCQVLSSFKRLHSFEPSYLSKVWKIAKGEAYDKKILAELNVTLQATSARLRIQVLPAYNPRGDEFRADIARMVEGKTINYHAPNGVVTEHSIAVPVQKNQATAINVNNDTFNKDELREGYAFMKLLGKAGYPLVQLAIG